MGLIGTASELKIPLRPRHHLLWLRLLISMQFQMTSAALLLHHVIHMTQNQREMTGLSEIAMDQAVPNIVPEGDNSIAPEGDNDGSDDGAIAPTHTLRRRQCGDLGEP